MSNQQQAHSLRIIKDLQEQGQFLSLSRSQPALFETPMDFCLANATQVSILAPGIIIFDPQANGDKDIVLSCGIHGNETAPIEICESLVKGILQGHIALKQRALFLFGNLPAMDIGQRFVEENMNRLFSGEHKNGPANYERTRAKALEEAVAYFYLHHSLEPANSRYHYDLHTAIRASKNDKFAVYPFRQDQPWDKHQLQILLACGVNTILLSGSATTTFSYYSSNNFGAHAFTVELGKVMAFGQNDMTRFSQVSNTLTKLLCGQALNLKAFLDADFLIYKVNQVINKMQPDFSLHFALDAPNFTDFPQDTLLAKETGTEYRAQVDGEAIVFPNADVELGQRALLTVIPTQI
jgi:succinylglutamate desuccinylase